MERRDFIRLALASCSMAACQPDRKNQLPAGRKPSRLFAARIPGSMSWEEKNFITLCQGLINRTEPRLYWIHTETDQFWLDYYRDTFHIPYEKREDPWQVIRPFMSEIPGYVLYDTAMPHELNLASMIGALTGSVPVSKDMENKVSRYGLKKMDDVSGRWRDLYLAYKWAIKELLPDCHRGMIAQLCVHHPMWQTTTFTNRDYTAAHRIFSVDISSSERDKTDYALIRAVYERFGPGAIVMGWHCARDKEHEAIALSSKYGHFGLCTLNSPNLTVHSAIPGTRKRLNADPVRKAVPANEDKVYIAFMTTDGDATWFVYNLISTDWANPLHGKMKYNWGFLPLTCDLMPGMFRYYCDHETPEDFFVAGPAGMAYTYPHMHPDPSRFLDLTARYMERCGMNTVHMTNWDDRTGWQEAEDKGFVHLLRKHLPDCAGYVRGMGESAFERNYIQGGNPYIFCGEGIHSTSDVYATLKEFMDACTNRPLFLFVLVNHTVAMDRIRDAVNRFPENTLELVHLDELLLRIKKAHEDRIITEELYPYKNGLTAILSKEARNAWPGFMEEIGSFRAAFSAGEKSYLEYVRSGPAGLEKVHTGEFLAFESVWHSMKLVKLTLETMGIYVNEKKEASRQFIRHFGSMAEASVVPYLHRLWDRWHDESIRFAEASILAERLCNLTEEMNVRLFARNS